MIYSLEVQRYCWPWTLSPSCAGQTFKRGIAREKRMEREESDTTKLATSNTELSRALQHISERRQSLASTIEQEESEKARVEQEIDRLEQQKRSLEASLDKRRSALREHDQTLSETKHAYAKLSESCSNLLTYVQDKQVSLEASLTSDSTPHA